MNKRGVCDENKDILHVYYSFTNELMHLSTSPGVVCIGEVSTASSMEVTAAMRLGEGTPIAEAPPFSEPENQRSSF